MDELATQCGVSLRTLEKSFVDFRGMTPVAHVRNVRLDRARVALGENGASVADVATRCGFKSSTTFAIEYRKRFGVPPSHVRHARRISRSVAPAMRAFDAASARASRAARPLTHERRHQRAEERGARKKRDPGVPRGGEIALRAAAIEHPADQRLQDAGAEEDADVDHATSRCPSARAGSLPSRPSTSA